MPKRDDAYMAAQRAAIAQAALDVFLEKGLYETSLRDICKAAGISIGALYTHFPTKEDAVVAAMARFTQAELQHPPPMAETWAEYIEQFKPLTTIVQPEGLYHQNLRLSFQLTAELAVRNAKPELYENYQAFSTRYQAAQLSLLRDKGFVALPLGPEQTAILHFHLSSGLVWRLTQAPGRTELEFEIFKRGLAFTAGLIEPGPPGDSGAPPAAR